MKRALDTVSALMGAEFGWKTLPLKAGSFSQARHTFDASTNVGEILFRAGFAKRGSGAKSLALARFSFDGDGWVALSALFIAGSTAAD